MLNVRSLSARTVAFSKLLPFACRAQLNTRRSSTTNPTGQREQNWEIGCFTPVLAMAQPSDFNIISYNLHGINAGRPLLRDLCNLPETCIIAVQELWLSPDRLTVLNDIHPDFSAHGVSGMTNRLKSGIYRGRPFGGVAFYGESP